MRPTRRIAAACASLVAAGAALPLFAAPAHAEPGYTYWGYYHLENGQWVASQEGADAYTPDDGAVEGFRWATTTAMPDRPPRTELTFDEICAGAEAGEGEKLVAIVVDYGIPEEAPDGDTPPEPEAFCPAVPTDASTQQALDAAADVRVENGLVCGINGFPTSTCSVEVADANPPSAEQRVDVALPAAASDDTEESAADADPASESAFPWALVGVVALVLILIAAAVLVTRKRNRVG